MIESFVIEAVAATGCVWIALLMFRRAPAAPPGPNLKALTAGLRRRHRREVRAILELAREHDRRHPTGSIEGFTAREALRSYLPDTLGAYLAVPAALRRVRRDGRPSPDEELSRQLAILHSGLARLQEADADAAAGRMAENGAFLHERFGAPPPLQPGNVHPAAAAAAEIANLLGAYLRRV